MYVRREISLGNTHLQLSGQNLLCTYLVHLQKVGKNNPSRWKAEFSSPQNLGKQLNQEHESFSSVNKLIYQLHHTQLLQLWLVTYGERKKRQINLMKR